MFAYIITGTTKSLNVEESLASHLTSWNVIAVLDINEALNYMSELNEWLFENEISENIDTKATFDAKDKDLSQNKLDPYLCKHWTGYGVKYNIQYLPILEN